MLKRTKCNSSKNAVTKCAAQYCYNTSEKPLLNFFNFPNNIKLARLWAIHVKREDIFMKPLSEIIKFALCDEHFENKYFASKTTRSELVFHLKPVPTIFKNNCNDVFYVESGLYSLYENENIQNSQNHCTTNHSFSDVSFSNDNNCVEVDINSNPEFGKLKDLNDLFEEFATSIVNAETDNYSTSEDYCRLCAKLYLNTCLFQIFDDWICNYGEMLQFCLPGKFTETDELSHKICKSCIEKLEYSNNALKSFIEANNTLKKIHEENKKCTNMVENIIASNLTEEELFIKIYPKNSGRSIKFQCTKCNKLFDKKSEINYHINHKHHINITLDKRSDLNTKLNNISKDTSVNNLNDYFEGQLQDTNEKVQNVEHNFQCTECFAIFDTKEKVINHGLEEHQIKSAISFRQVTVKPLNMEKLNISTNNVFFKIENDLKVMNEHSYVIQENLSDNIEASNLQTLDLNVDTKLDFDNENTDLKENFEFHLKNDNLEIADHTYSTFQYNEIKTENDTKSLTNDTIIKNTEIDEITKTGDTEMFEIKFWCVNCYKLFKNKENLETHSLNKHPENKIDFKMVKIKKKTENVKRELPSSTRFECIICSSLHKTKDTLVKHTQRQHSEKLNNGKVFCRMVMSKRYQKNNITCLRCKQEFDSIFNYRIHLKTHIKFKCKECDANFDKHFNLRQHYRNTHKEFKRFYVCIECDKKFTKKAHLEEHEEIHKVPKKNVSCVKCNKEFMSDFELRKHEKNHDKFYLCNICGRQCLSLSMFHRHLEVHNIERLYKCNICTKSYKTSRCLELHKETHNKDKRYVCQICGKMYISKTTLSVHLKSHSSVKPHKCNICGMSFHRRDYLSRHRQSHSRISDFSVHTCIICHKVFNNKSSYLYHMFQHTGSKDLYACDICNKRFSNPYTLKIHSRLHTGERPFKCGKCEKTFRCKTTLVRHELIHGEFMFNCDFCDKKFARKDALLYHIKSHTGERPFPCSICNKSFKIKMDLIRHARIHKRQSDQRQNLV